MASMQNIGQKWILVSKHMSKHWTEMDFSFKTYEFAIVVFISALLAH